MSTCNEFAMLVGLTKQIYRCMNCGSDLEQHINGKISYLHITRPEHMDVFVKSGLNNGSTKFVHFVPRPKPRKRPGRHTKNLNQRKDRIKNTADKAVDKYF